MSKITTGVFWQRLCSKACMGLTVEGAEQRRDGEEGSKSEEELQGELSPSVAIRSRNLLCEAPLCDVGHCERGLNCWSPARRGKPHLRMSRVLGWGAPVQPSCNTENRSIAFIRVKLPSSSRNSPLGSQMDSRVHGHGRFQSALERRCIDAWQGERLRVNQSVTCRHSVQ
jgi:hypothetical protein